MDVSPIVRTNHVSSNEILRLKSNFYHVFDDFTREKQRLKLLEKEVHVKISDLIDKDQHLRITYIYLKRMINKTKVDFHKIPKVDFLSFELKNYFYDFLNYRNEVKKYEAQLEQSFKQEIDKGNSMMVNLVQQKQTIQNALMLTNYSMYKKFQTSTNTKTMDKVWKILMRSYAKIAPLSTFTSLSFTNTTIENRRIELDQSILLKLFYLLLLLDEVLFHSSYVVDYEKSENGIMVESFLENIEMNSTYIGNQSRKFILESEVLLELESGTVLSANRIMQMLGNKGKGLALFRRLIQYGYFKNTALGKDLTIDDLLQFLLKYEASTSNRLKEIISILKVVKHDLDCLKGKEMAFTKREHILNEIESRIKQIFELAGNQKDFRSSSLLSEDHYVSSNTNQFAFPNYVQTDLETYKEILPIFDHRLLFQFLTRNELVQGDAKVPFNDIKLELVKFAEKYEKQALTKDFSNSMFTDSQPGYVLNQLKQRYYHVIADTLTGNDVTLSSEFIGSIANVLNEYDIKRHCYDTFLFQQVTKEHYVVNHIKSSYLGNYFRHVEKDQQKEIYEKLKYRVTSGREDIATFSPSYGFNPNRIPLSGGYELVDHKSLLPHQIDIGECSTCWDPIEKRFMFLDKNNKEFIPVYIGSLASYNLSEDFKLVTYLGQSAFLSGMTIEYDGIPIGKPFVKIGRITFGSLTLQRRKYILHSSHLEDITPDFKGFEQLIEIMEQYKIPKVSFVRIFLIQDEKLSIIYGETGLHKPLFFDVTEPVFFNRMIRHIHKQIKKYNEVAVVFEESLPNPYQQDYITEISIDI